MTQPESEKDEFLPQQLAFLLGVGEKAKDGSMLDGTTTIDGPVKHPEPEPLDLEAHQEQPLESELDDCIPLLLELFPDACPAYLLSTLESFEHHPQRLEVVIEAITERSLPKNGGYPKRADTIKALEEADHQAASMYAKNSLPLDEVTDARVAQILGNSNYSECTFQSLLFAFPAMPKTFVRKQMQQCRGLFAPSWLALDREQLKVPPPYRPLQCPRTSAAPEDRYGLLTVQRDWKDASKVDPLYQREVLFLEELGVEKVQAEDSSLAKQLNLEEYEASGNLIECECCFADFAFEDMVQCMEGHLFCKDCARRAAEEEIGRGKCALRCMSGEGCQATFPTSVIQSFLSAKTFKLLSNMKQAEEIRGALTEESNYETCPFCPYGAFMEATPEHNKLFHCENCNMDSCRLCRKKSHIPLRCEEVQEESVLKLRHRMEEGMTEALLRECWKCKKKFFKEDGCNKMSCQCGAKTCYVCRKGIQGYEHFYEQRPVAGKCPLWDDSVKRNAQDVLDAARKLAEVVKKDAAEDEGIQERLDKEQKELMKDLEEKALQGRPKVPGVPAPAPVPPAPVPAPANWQAPVNAAPVHHRPLPANIQQPARPEGWPYYHAIPAAAQNAGGARLQFNFNQPAQAPPRPRPPQKRHRVPKRNYRFVEEPPQPVLPPRRHGRMPPVAPPPRPRAAVRPPNAPLRVPNVPVVPEVNAQAPAPIVIGAMENVQQQPPIARKRRVPAYAENNVEEEEGYTAEELQLLLFGGQRRRRRADHQEQRQQQVEEEAEDAAMRTIDLCQEELPTDRNVQQQQQAQRQQQDPIVLD